MNDYILMIVEIFLVREKICFCNVGFCFDFKIFCFVGYYLCVSLKRQVFWIFYRVGVNIRCILDLLYDLMMCIKKNLKIIVMYQDIDDCIVGILLIKIMKFNIEIKN